MLEKDLPSSGYLYGAFGEKYINEAITSADSMKAADAQAHITLVSDTTVDCSFFDHQIRLNFGQSDNWKQKLVAKIDSLLKSPYDKTIFLDSDTYIVSPVREIFDLLAYFDFCLTLAPADLSPVYENGKSLKGLGCYNTGVIAYRKSSTVMNFLTDWREDYLNNLADYGNDQPSFMHTLMKSQVRIHILQQTYNARTNLAIALPGAPVKIIHGRHDDFSAIVQRINRAQSNRTWCPILQDIISIGPSFTPLNLAWRCVQRIYRGYQ